MSQLIGLWMKWNKSIKAPCNQKVLFWIGDLCPFGTHYIGERRTTFAKAYGWKVRYYWKLFGEHVRNSETLCFEMKSNPLIAPLQDKWRIICVLGVYSIVGFDESSLNLLRFFPIFNTEGLSSKDLNIQDWRAKDQLIAEAPILVIISNKLLVHCICWRLDKQTSATNCCLHRSCILSFMRCTELWRRWCDYVHPLWNTNHTNFRCFSPFWIYKNSLVYEKNHQLQLRHTTL